MQVEDEKKKIDTQKKQAKVGIKSSQGNWAKFISTLGVKTMETLNDLIKTGKLAEGELDESELRSLSTFADEDASNILILLRDGNFSHKIGNKSGFLAGIIRRYSKDLEAKASSHAVGLKHNDEPASSTPVIAEDSKLSRREKKRIEEQEVQVRENIYNVLKRSKTFCRSLWKKRAYSMRK
jgi:hypothetical protein